MLCAVDIASTALVSDFCSKLQFMLLFLLLNCVPSVFSLLHFIIWVH